MAIDLIDQVRALHGRKGSYLFPNYGDPDNPGPMSRHVLSRNVLTLCADTGFTKSVPSDLRRTVKTRMSELGIAKDVRDRLQNHAAMDDRPSTVIGTITWPRKERLQNDGVISWKLRFQLGTWYQCENPAKSDLVSAHFYHANILACAFDGRQQ